MILYDSDTDDVSTLYENTSWYLVYSRMNSTIPYVI